MDITSEKFKSLKNKAQNAREKIEMLGIDEVRSRDFDFQKSIHVPIIKKYLVDVENAIKRKQKCKLANQLFQYIVTFKDWLEKVPNFKQAVKNKLEDFMRDETIPIDLFNPHNYAALLFPDETLLRKPDTPSSLVEPLEEMSVNSVTKSSSQSNVTNSVQEVTNDPSPTISDVENVTCKVLEPKSMAYDYEPAPNFNSAKEQYEFISAEDSIMVREGDMTSGLFFKNEPEPLVTSLDNFDYLNIDLQKKTFSIKTDEHKKEQVEKYFSNKKIKMEMKNEGLVEIFCSILDIVSLEKEKPEWFFETKME